MKKACVIACLAAATLFIVWISNPTSIFASRGLETAVREQINKSNGDITPEDCVGITELNLSSSDWNTSLEGIQYFIDLEKLDCSAGIISDISALSALTHLKELRLYKNRVTDLTALSKLVSLERLDLYDNNVSDLSPLADLTNLKHLVIGKNPAERIPDGFAPLVNLYGLQIGSYADYDIVVSESSIPRSPLAPE